MSGFGASPRAELGIAMAAGLMGAAGLALAAVAAHKVQAPELATAANFMVVNAAAVLAVTSWAVRSADSARWWRVSARLLLLGTALFAGDIAARNIGGFKLFQMAPPLGGLTMIAGWVCISVAALVEWKRAGPGG